MEGGGPSERFILRITIIFTFAPIHAVIASILEIWLTSLFLLLRGPRAQQIIPQCPDNTHEGRGVDLFLEVLNEKR